MQSVRYERSGAVGHIVLCNPPHNLLNVEFYEQLREAILNATSDDLRAVLVRAEGPNFCGGGDTAVLGSLTPAEFRLLTTEYNRSFRALEAMQVPTVAAVRGSVSLRTARRAHMPRCGRSSRRGHQAASQEPTR
jgi:enoyl-CoA hydratase/carnithine racemase